MNIAIAIIKHPKDDRILIAQRKADVHLANFWEFPGGKCHPGETLRQAVRRETREEVGLEIDILEEWNSITHDYPGRTVTLFPFLCRALSDDARPLGNGKVAWVTVAELPNYEFPEANAPLIRRLLRSTVLTAAAV
ncbi:NUDIX hydrolase [Capsulimonas corticalis]|uniref:8-oxo-dGTP diphosphatase n=1 Tax=Capsulimonas corticalis TaxID=2219043 RepID=A0A402CXR1_9BACT|nr:8-oxo-dGTP diphosphatase MutT [Capsulimonas corticalis]BDI32203.1 NUDIX hydrolase [Capsulimonas corticalis]